MEGDEVPIKKKKMKNGRVYCDTINTILGAFKTLLNKRKQ